MRFISTLLFLAVTIGALQAQRDISPAITDALSKGDAVTLSSYFNDNVELVIGSINDVFSKKQATGIVADFFRKNKVNSFQILHKGSKENSAFSICTLRSGTTSYRVYILVRRTSDEQQLIQQLRIESSND
jgi:hypothetical protein